MKMRFLLALLLAPLPLMAQFSVVTCTHGETGVCRQVNSCSQANVQAAISASSAGGDGYANPTSLQGDGVYIPAGSCTWSSPVSWTDKNIGVIGGVGGTTTISGSGDLFQVSVTGAAGNHTTTAASFRISGLTQSGGHLLNINVSNPNMTTWAGFYRVDNINYTTSAGGNNFIIYGPVYGVFDHLTGSVSGGNHFEQAMFLNSEYPPTSSRLLGQTVGETYAIGLGDQNAVYIEDSSFVCNGSFGSGALSDSESGPQRMVLRHNTITGSCYNYAHWTRSGEWDGGRLEIYNNNYNCSDASCPGSGGYPGRFNAGTGVIFNNTINGYPTTSFQIDEARGCGAETSTPAGACPNSNFDRSAGDASAPGWPCAGQVGSACIAGSCTASTMNSVPFIMWNNGTQSGCSTGGSCTNSLTFNVDGPPGGGSCTRTMTNYLKSTAHTSSSLNGAIDYGSFASQPSSVGIYTGIGSYAPFTYPYPTTTGGTNFSLSITAVNGSVSGLNCSAGSYASGTSIGACTATPNTGYHLVSWSGTGSGATCSGTGTCGPFSLAVNSTLTATFALNSWTLTTATAGSGSGTITGCAGAHNFGASFSCTVTATSGAITSVSGCGGSGTTTFTGTMPNNACTVTATFSNTLATPTFTPPAGTYSAQQTVNINAIAGTTVVTMTEGSNGNASNGDAPSRNAYTNCATGYNGTALTPVGQPVGNLYCTATAKANALAAGGPNQGVVTSSISGVGTHSLDNGNGAGGTGSLASITATYGQANQNGCPVGTNIATSIPGVNLLGNVASANTTYGAVTQSSGFNTSSLEPTKWVVSNGNNALYWVRETCQKVNTTSVGGEHLEYDANYNTTAGVYIGEGWDFDFPNSKFRAGPQNSPWKNLKLKRIPDGTVLTTWAWPANHWIYTQIWMHHDPACSTATPGTASSCTYYWDRLCIADYTAGTALTCYDLIDAVTNVTPQGSGLDKSTWTRNEFALQHQWDVNAASATLINTVDFDNLVAFSMTPNAYYTVDGSTPTTGSTPYFLPVPVPSSLTIKALANQSGFTNSAVGSAVYTITPTNSLVTTATNGSISGSNCASGSYATGASIGACTATPSGGFSFTGWSGTGACSGASGTGTTSCTLSSNATLTATFAPIVTCGDPTQLSPNFSGTYTVPPTTVPFTIGFTSPTAGCTMVMTVDGSTPNAGCTISGSTQAYANQSISSTTTMRVRACQGGYVDSGVVGGTWTVNAAGTTTSVMGGTLTLSGTQGVQ